MAEATGAERPAMTLGRISPNLKSKWLFHPRLKPAASSIS